MSQLKLWDFLSARGENTILRWVREARLTTRDRAALNQKLARLQQIDFELAIGTKLLAGPIYRHIYKLIPHSRSQVELPAFCSGRVRATVGDTIAR
jgi:hypothetical protein